MGLIYLKNGDSWSILARAINALNDEVKALTKGRPGPGLARTAGGTIYVAQRQSEPVKQQAASSVFYAKITANDPAYTFAEVTLNGSTWVTKTDGKTGTARNIAEEADTDIEKVPVDSIVVVYTITSGGTKYYVFSRDIGGGVNEEPPALAALVELASTQGTRDEDYWRADLSLTGLAYNISNDDLKSKLEMLLHAGGFVDATVTLSGGPCPTDTTIAIAGAWDTVPLLAATSHLTGDAPTITVTQVDTTHQLVDFGGTITGGTFDLKLSGYNADKPVCVQVLTDHRYNTADHKMTYKTRQVIYFGGDPVYIGPECSDDILVTTAMVHE